MTLEPFDVYFTDFESAGGTSKPKLWTFDIRKKLPVTAMALQDAIPDVLRGARLVQRDRAELDRVERIRVDNSRSAPVTRGRPTLRTIFSLLRVRVDKTGCDEINFDTYMHELGHCVEGRGLLLRDGPTGRCGACRTPHSVKGSRLPFQDRSDHDPRPQDANPIDDHGDVEAILGTLRDRGRRPHRDSFLPLALQEPRTRRAAQIHEVDPPHRR